MSIYDQFPRLRYDLPKDADIKSAKIVTVDRLDGTTTERDVTNEVREGDPIREIILAVLQQHRYPEDSESQPHAATDAVIEALHAAGYTIVHDENVNQMPPGDCTWCKGPCRGGHPYD